MAPRKKATVKAGPTPAQIAAQKAAALAAERAEAKRQAEEDMAARAGGAGNDDPNAPPNEGAGVEFTHAETGGVCIVQPLAVTHVQPSRGSVLHSDPKRAANNEKELAEVTEIGTVGGLVIKVLEDVETVAEACGL